MTISELISRKDNKVYWVKTEMDPEEFTFLKDVVIAKASPDAKKYIHEVMGTSSKMTPDLPIRRYSHLDLTLQGLANAGLIDDIIRTLEASLKETPSPSGTVYHLTEEERVAISEFLEGMKGVETGTTITSLEYGLLAHFEQDTIIIEGTSLTFYDQLYAVEKLTRDKQLIIIDPYDPWGLYEGLFGDRLEVYETLEYRFLQGLPTSYP